MSVDCALVFGWTLDYDQYVKAVQHHLSQKGKNMTQKDLEDPEIHFDVFGDKRLQFELGSVSFSQDCPFEDRSFFLGVHKDWFTKDHMKILVSCEDLTKSPMLEPICNLLNLTSEPEMMTL
jgi:hypothetical protein